MGTSVSMVARRVLKFGQKQVLGLSVTISVLLVLLLIVNRGGTQSTRELSVAAPPPQNMSHLFVATLGGADGQQPGIAVIDTKDNVQVKSIALDATNTGIIYDRSMLISRDGTQVYKGADNGYYVLNTNTFELGRVVIGPNSTLVDPAINADGSRLYTFAYIQETCPAISNQCVAVIDILNKHQLTAIPLPDIGPLDMLINPQGTELWVVGLGGIVRISTATNAILETRYNNSLDGALNILFNKGGDAIYTTVFEGERVDRHDATSSTFAKTARVIVGSGTVSAVLSPKGDRLYTTNTVAQTVSVLDTLSNKVIATIPVGVKPWGIAIDLSGDQLYVPSVSGNAVWVIDTTQNKVSSIVATDKNPYDLVFAP